MKSLIVSQFDIFFCRYTYSIIIIKTLFNTFIWTCLFAKKKKKMLSKIIQKYSIENEYFHIFLYSII